MNKFRLAASGIIAIAMASTAHAQSSVTLFGIIDATLAHGSGSVASRTQLTNSGYNGSRLGFQGTEDLGGGMKAGFWLEAGVSVDNGTGGPSNTNNQASGVGSTPAGTQGLTFNRRSTASVGGPLGELRVGRDYTPTFWSLTYFDPFGANGVGANQVFLSQAGGLSTTGAGLYPVGTSGPVVRTSNSIAYLYGHGFNAHAVGGSGFNAFVQYYLGENASNVAAPLGKRDGTGFSARLGYGSGPFTVAAAFARTSYASGDVHVSNIGGEYDFGVAKVVGLYNWDRIDSAVAIKGRGGFAGLMVPMGPGLIRTAYSRYRFENAAGNPTASKVALGYVYNLSKRTLLYATYAHVNNNAASNQALNGSVTGAGMGSSGYDLGIRHAF